MQFGASGPPRSAGAACARISLATGGCSMRRLEFTGWMPPTAANLPTMRSALFVTGDDFMRLAMQAYYAACKGMLPPAGETWLSGGDDPAPPVPFSGPEDLHDAFLAHLSERLRQHARKTGHYRDHTVHSAPGAGRSPANAAGVSMAHGCAAVGVIAVGTAPVFDQSRAEARSGEPLLSGLAGQELPSGAGSTHTQAAQEAA